MGFSFEVLNNIRANASQEYQARIPEATQQTILSIGQAFETYDLVYNEFCAALWNVVGKTLIESKLFENKLARFKKGEILTQQDVEEIFVEMASAEGQYDAKGLNPFGRRDPSSVKTLYHRQNRQDYYCISIGDIDFVRVFRSEATLDSFITAQINSVYSGANYDEWLAMKNVLATYDGYFNVNVQEISGSNKEAACKDFVKRVRKMVNDLTFVSDQYNAEHVKTWSDAGNLVIFVHKDVVTEIDVEVLAKAFNMGKTDIQIEVVTMDDFGDLTDTYALLVDKDWFRVYDTLSKMEPQRNAQGLFTNYFYHVHQILSASRFKNAVRFTTAEVA